MIMGTRNLDKEMLKSARNFSTTVKLCHEAHSGNKTLRYKGLLSSLETTYTKLDEDFALFKDDMIKKVCKTETAFNAVSDQEGVEVDDYPNNDKWSDEHFQKYVQVRDLLESALEAEAKASGTGQEDTIDVELIVDEMRVEFTSIETAVGKLSDEIERHSDGQMPVSSVVGYKDIIEKLAKRIDADLKCKVQAKLVIAVESADANFTNAKIRLNLRNFMQEQKEKLDNCTMILIKKSVVRDIEEVKPRLQSFSSDSTVGDKPREQVFLEKTRPPKFNGDELEFPEFLRKWQSQVNKANLPEETELDKLRDNIPKDAKDQIYGITKLDEAWQILSRRFGDKMLLGKKLKDQLKNVQVTGKSDPERLINQ